MDYMEAQPALAKNFVKGYRVAADSLWTDLAKKMNSNGPPHKDANGWKKGKKPNILAQAIFLLVFVAEFSIFFTIFILLFQNIIKIYLNAL